MAVVMIAALFMRETKIKEERSAIPETASAT
jgi:hypothetical protein